MFITSVRLNLENEHISVLTLLCVYVRYNALGYTMGGDIGGTVPQNLRWGMAHASDPPNIWKSSVIGNVRKYEQKNRVIYVIYQMMSGY